MSDREAPKFDPEDVRGLLYEYRMLVAMAQAWIARRSQPNNACDFAVLESFLVHARNLHAFLRTRKDKEKDRRPGDYFAADFVEGFGVEVYERETVEKINRWLQHLTTWRYDDDEHPEWSLHELFLPVVKAMDDFLTSLETTSHGKAALTECHDSGKLVAKALLSAR